jgi:predicted DNA-binding transcriptional regulator AlpA
MARHGITRREAMTREELLRLPAVIDVPTANRALGLGRSKGYELAKRGRYPCKVLKAGRSYRVVTADLLRVLEIEPGPFVLAA